MFGLARVSREGVEGERVGLGRGERIVVFKVNAWCEKKGEFRRGDRSGTFEL